MCKIIGPITFLILVGSVVILFLTRTTQAQEVTRSVKEGGMGYFMFGGNIIDIGDLNSRLKRKGYSELSDRFYSLGGGGYGLINRIVIGGEGHGLIGDSTTGGNHKISLAAGYGFFNLGYLVYSTSHLNVYPILGLGGGGLGLNISQREALSFDEILDKPNRSANLSTGGFLLNFALGTDYLLKRGGDGAGKEGLVIGVRIGYTFDPTPGDWSLSGTDLSDGPDIGITGAYVRMVIGGGWISAERKRDQ